MQLVDLPVDILAEIFTGPNSWMATMMWRTGDSLLRRKMALGGVRRLHLTSSVSKKWPKCLYDFRHLVELRFFSHAENFTPMLVGLSDTIEHLELNGGDAVSILLCGKSSAQFDAAMPTDQDIMSQNDKQDSSSATFFRFDAQFPLLRHLTLSQTLSINPVSELNAAPLASLPSSLTSLKIAVNYHGSSELNFQGMPKVSTLSLSSNLLNSTNIHKIPSPESITSLEVWDSKLWTLLATSQPPIFPNLLIPPWDPYEYWKDEDDEAWELLDHEGHLPQNIRSLCKLEDIDDTFLWATRFPPGLTSLEIDGDSYNNSAESFPSINAKWILMVMPRTLTRFIVSAIDWSDITANIWPPQLSTLKHRHAEFIDPRLFHRLPRTLTDLELSHGTPESDLMFLSQISIQPFEIDELWQLGRSALTMETQLWTKTKERLLRRCESEPEGDWREYVSNIENGALFGLPTSLTEIKFNSACATQLMGFLLPPNLVNFDIRTTNEVRQYKLWKHPPPSLIDFKFTFRSISSSPPFDSIAAARFLVYFTLSLEKPIVLSVLRGITTHLPPNLLYLSITAESDTALPIEDLALPSRLETLILVGIIIQPVKAWFHVLPRSLTYLRVPEAHGADLCHLPPHLTHFSARLQTLTFPQLYALPRSLCRFEYGWIVYNIFLPTLKPFYTLWDEPEEVRLAQWKEARSNV